MADRMIKTKSGGGYSGNAGVNKGAPPAPMIKSHERSGKAPRKGESINWS